MYLTDQWFLIVELSFSIAILKLFCKEAAPIEDSGDFINKMSQLGDIPENIILVTAYVVGPYPSIRHKAGLKSSNPNLSGWGNFTTLSWFSLNNSKAVTHS